MAAPPPITMKRTLWLTSTGSSARKLGAMASAHSPGPLTCRSQLVHVFHEALELLEPLLDGELQILPQERPVHVLLVGLDDRVAVVRRRQPRRRAGARRTPLGLLDVIHCRGPRQNALPGNHSIRIGTGSGETLSRTGGARMTGPSLAPGGVFRILTGNGRRDADGRQRTTPRARTGAGRPAHPRRR